MMTPNWPLAAPALLAEGLIDLQSLWTLLKAGGNTMWFLAALSVVGLAFTLERLVRLRKSAINPRGLAEEAEKHLIAGNYDAVEELSRKRPSTMGRMLRFCVRHRDQPLGELTKAAEDIAGNELKLQLAAAYPLAVVATLAPLLGLFGTVIGMINAFQQFKALGKHADPSDFAGSISMALVTTATGLAIAIPAIIFYQFFRTRTQRIGIGLAEDFNDVLADWKWSTKQGASHAG